MSRLPSKRWGLEFPTIACAFQSWWSRMSNQFRRLKLTHTLRHGVSTNRLAPFPDDGESSLDATMKERRKPAAVSNGPPSPALGGKDGGAAWAVKTKDSGETGHNHEGIYSIWSRVNRFVVPVPGHCRAASEKEDFLITTMVGLCDNYPRDLFVPVMLPSCPAQERSAFDPAAQRQVKGRHPSLPASVQLRTVELGSFAPPQGREE